jgi:hypothetical protein
MRKSFMVPPALTALFLCSMLGAHPSRPSATHAQTAPQPLFTPAGLHLHRAPRIPVRFGSSTNWSGYVVNGANGSVTDVKGSWSVPAVVAGPNCGSSYSAAWIGIDGDTDGTVEQCGTEQDSSGRMYAWYEMYPKGSAAVYSVNAGDQMAAEVKYGATPGKFTLTITDTTTRQSYTTTQKLAQAQRNSAEWIMEAPWSGGVLPLAEWSSFGFSGCESSLGGPGAGNPITMVSASDGTTPKAAPVNLSSNGFSVTWMNCK